MKVKSNEKSKISTIPGVQSCAMKTSGITWVTWLEREPADSVQVRLSYLSVGKTGTCREVPEILSLQEPDVPSTQCAPLKQNIKITLKRSEVVTAWWVVPAQACWSGPIRADWAFLTRVDRSVALMDTM